MTAGSEHCLGLKNDKTIVAWGRNDMGQCDVPAPNSDFIAVAGGLSHSLGLKSDGTIVAWGSNSMGQCSIPEPNTDFVAIAGGNNHSLGLKSDGTIVAWGWNGYGQCNLPSPNQDFIAIAAGANHSLAIRDEGITSLADDTASVPAALAICAVTPNPFNSRTTIWLDLPQNGTVTLAVYDYRGRLVHTLWSGPMDAGRHPVGWDGMDDRGCPVASGIYLVRLMTAAGRQQSAKITLAK
ncbi:MAG: FlgD immunoglobulin-like domain containing protein [Candidatus Krumholzibacteria bacterium]|nr:FlgD immunoglobulin-like domain containing protein [Candidatus Krumholzibacteria bacterium]